MKSNFVDYVKIFFTSGKGGDGIVHWRKEKHVPRGGPDGGDGGRGGHIILKGNKQLWTLLDLKYRKYIKAEHGQPGQGQRMNGRDGQDITLQVPVGTVVKEAETGRILAEITEHGQEYTLVKGGDGGQGNWHYRTSTNQTPDYAQKGRPPKELAAILELKLLADVGLVGYPNVGKSTLLSVLSSARPEIADYPFTTLKPNLGIVRYRDYLSFVMADIPGIIEGAHEGRGLGHHFLRHIERNSTLLFMIPADSPDHGKEYKVLLKELKLYEPELLDKPRLVAITKSDLASPEVIKKLKASFKRRKQDIVFISSVAQQGLDELKDKLWALLADYMPEPENDAAPAWDEEVPLHQRPYARRIATDHAASANELES